MVLDIKATVVHRYSMVIHQLSENKSGLQSKTFENTFTIRGKQWNNRNTALQQKQTPTLELFKTTGIPDLVKEMLTKK